MFTEDQTCFRRNAEQLTPFRVDISETHAILNDDDAASRGRSTLVARQGVSDIVRQDASERKFVEPETQAVDHEVRV